MSKGDIVLIPFPFTDLSGHKVRPALVLYTSKNSEDCIVAFLSSVKQKRMGAFDLPITPSERNGLKVNSTIKVDKIATLQKKIVIGELGVLEKSFISIIEGKLRMLFSI